MAMLLRRQESACPHSLEAHAAARAYSPGEAVCHQGRTYLYPMADCCMDDAEALALAVLRFVAAGYMTSDVVCWDAAHDAAERILGPLEGPQFVAAMTGVIRAVRRAQRSDWHFMPATCGRATSGEKSLIGFIRCARCSPLHEQADGAENTPTGEEIDTDLNAVVFAAAARVDALQRRIEHRGPWPAGTKPCGIKPKCDGSGIIGPHSVRDCRGGADQDCTAPAVQDPENSSGPLPVCDSPGTCAVSR